MNGYKVLKYAPVSYSRSAGTRAGMWALEETRTRTIAFFDTEQEALEMIERLKLSHPIPQSFPLVDPIS
jgi:hypothetical protein